jgi:WD40 repeat protein
VWTARSVVALKLSFRPGDPEVLLCSLGDGSVRIFDLRVQRPLISSIPVVPDRGRALIVAEFSPGGDLIATGADDTVRILDFRRFSHSVDGHQRAAQSIRAVRMKPLQRGTCGVSGVSWSRGGRLVLANYMGGDIVMFDTIEAQKRLLQKPVRNPESPAVPGVPEVAESREATTEVVVEEGDIPTVSAESSVRQRFHGRSNQRTFAKEVRFLFEDRYVVSGGDCGNLFIWRTNDGTLLQRLRADGSICNCVAPHPTLPLVAASGIDDTVKLFEVGGFDRPPLVRREPPISRGRRLLNAVSAAHALRGSGANPSCRSWLPTKKRYVCSRLISLRMLISCCPFRARPQQTSQHADASAIP